MAVNQSACKPNKLLTTNHLLFDKIQTVTTLLLVSLCTQLHAATPTDLNWYRFSPLVIAHDSSQPITMTVAMKDASAANLTVSLTNGDKVTLAHLGGGIYSAQLSAVQVLHNHVVNDAHNHIGFLELPGPCPPLQNGCLNLFVNVRTAQMPDVPIAQLATDAQASTHIVNLRQDSLHTNGQPSSATLQRFYELYDDDFDFIAQVDAVRSVKNRNFRGIRNAITGIGVPVFDNGAANGSPDRLLGTIEFPVDSFFDLAETGSHHEIGHCWINFLNTTALSNRPFVHWPLSDVGYGIMGISIPPTGQGGNFAWDLTVQPSGDVLVQSRSGATEFNDLELYLMGLIPDTEVADHFVLPNQDLAQMQNGAILPGPVTTVTIDDIIQGEGARVPASTQRTDRVYNRHNSVEW